MGGREISFEREGDATLRVRLAGRWGLEPGLPGSEEIRRALAEPLPSRVVFETAGLEQWDTTLVAVVAQLDAAAREREIPLDPEGLPAGLRRLLGLATAVPERGARGPARREPILARIGELTRSVLADGRDFVEFLGEVMIALLRWLTGRARVRASDFGMALQECGASALPIVSLISLLVGLILAFVGAVQLRQFGASIYVADLVGIAMTREMGAMMTGIIMAGRTGAAFAATIGNMRVTEEVDALQTFGISPVEFLVLPRVLALFVMMPLLTLYADFVGMAGGLIVSVGMLDIQPDAYIRQTSQAVDLTNFSIGVAKSFAFGALVALSGCLRGMQCGRDSSAVGLATTSAVVSGIVLIIVTDAIFTLVCNALGI